MKIFDFHFHEHARNSNETGGFGCFGIRSPFTAQSCRFPMAFFICTRLPAGQAGMTLSRILGIADLHGFFFSRKYRQDIGNNTLEFLFININEAIRCLSPGRGGTFLL
jgi:hypothetical protein